MTKEEIRGVLLEQAQKYEYMAQAAQGDREPVRLRACVRTARAMREAARLLEEGT